LKRPVLRLSRSRLSKSMSQRETGASMCLGKSRVWLSTKAEWAKAYSELADKVALAGRAAPENRIEKFRRSCVSPMSRPSISSTPLRSQFTAEG
jgi:hypothetical protein